MSDAEFERRLLDSARADAPTDDPRSAWARLAGVSSSIEWGPRSGAAADSRRRGSETTPSATVAGRRLWPAAARASRRAAVKGLLLGAIGGSALTAAIMIRSRHGRTDGPAARAEASRAPANVADATDVPARASLPDIQPAAVSETSIASAATHPRHSGPERARPTQDLAGPAVFQDESVEASAAESSTLAAEVSRIDAARIANARGDYDQAIRTIERYHRDFPNGALAPDADVVALEAVAAKRDRPETARRAALFLSRHPGDPHTARVKWLEEH